MSQPYLAEIRIFAFNFPPKGWALANGQTLPLNQNQALFALLGTTYGGNGINTFALPNLQGAMPMHAGGSFVLGATGGETTHILLTNEMPEHTHMAMASTNAADQSSPSNNYWAEANNAYNSAGNVAMDGIAAVGGGQSHDNMPPYLVTTMAIALQGIFPSRN